MIKTKVWKVQQDVLREITPGGLDLEERIHKWIEYDLSIVLPNSILIGSKVKTDHGKELDLLAIDENGDLIILELKRGLTSREITTQVLDFASWAATLTINDLNEILLKRGETRSIIELISEKYGNDEEPNINENQKIYIVASEVDAITERICKYLADNGVKLNVVTFNYYKNGESELIAKNILVSEMESPNDTAKNISGRFTNKLFDESKLDIGHKVRYLPAKSKGVEVIAEISSKGRKCLNFHDSSELYSFSGLRKQVILDNDLDLIPFYTYSQWGEWEHVDKGVKLSEL